MIVHRLVKYIEKKGNYESTEEIINLLYDTYFTNNIFKKLMEYLVLLLMELKLFMGLFLKKKFNKKKNFFNNVILGLKDDDLNNLTISVVLLLDIGKFKFNFKLFTNKLNFKNKKTSAKQKKLFIHMKDELIDEKYEIYLI